LERLLVIAGRREWQFLKTVEKRGSRPVGLDPLPQKQRLGLFAMLLGA
jgi:hypothetical protein